MRILADQDLFAVTVAFLRTLGHDVVTARDLGLSRADDAQILNEAQNQRRILVTRDRDYGNLVFVQMIHSGVLYLRFESSPINAVHQQLATVLQQYSENALMRSFVVISARGHRIRRIS